MKKTIRNLICVLVFLALLAGCTGCRQVVELVFSMAAPSVSEAPSKEDDTVAAYQDKVKFYNDEGEPEYLSRETLLSYETAYPKCNGNYYRKLLSGEELVLYNALLYAMEHCFENVVLNVKDSSMDFYKPREFLSLDSPFLEQNYSPDEGVTTIGNRVRYQMARFCEADWALKMQALSKAEEIAASIPSDADSQEARMLYLYDYVRNNIRYSTYEDDAQAKYLYDALCVGKTNCDGYSNSLSLLFHLAGIECCEAMGRGSEEPDADDGHTWVVAPLNGIFYNFDATSDTVDDSGYRDYRCYFGVSDPIMNMAVFDYDDVRPVCHDKSRDFIMADGIFRDMMSYEAARGAAKLCNSRAQKGKMNTLFAFTGNYTEADVEDFIDVYIELLEYGESISYVTMCGQDRTLILITVEE